jgi:predicted RNA-binding protein associated with RNAse of E/G family
MPRNAGATIDPITERVLDRDGRWHDVQHLTKSPSGLFYERPLEPHPGRILLHHQRWVLPEHGWVINRHRFAPHAERPVDFYIEPDIITVDSSGWRIQDAYLDVFVLEGNRYEIDDADEFGEALAAGDITVAEAALALDAFSRLLRALERHGFSGRRLLAEYAPDLPAPDAFL